MNKIKVNEFKNIKLVALDLDGTLLDDNSQVSEKSVKAIEKLLNKGIKVILITGRTLKSAYNIRKSIGLNIPIVAYNGGRVIIPTTEDVHDIKIPLSEALKIIRYGEAEGLYVKVYIDDVLYVEDDEEISRAFSIKHGIEYKAVGKLSDVIDNDVNMIVIYYNEDIHGKIDDRLKNIDVEITASEKNELEFIPKGVSKEKGLRVVADYFNVQREEILAIGNSKNDLEMLRFAGIGIAMKNSDSMLLEHWENISEYTNDEEGVYHILNKL